MDDGLARKELYLLKASAAARPELLPAGQLVASTRGQDCDGI